MSKCEKCNIEFNGNLDRCPLCNWELKGKKTDSVYPKIKKSSSDLLHKILLFVSITIGIIFGFVEYNISKKFVITKYVSFGLLTNYLSVRFILRNYKYVLKKMNNYFIFILFIFFLWYFITKSLFITTFLIPILCLIIFLFNSITLIVLRNTYIVKFAKTIILDNFVGLIPLLLTLLNLSTFKILSYICAVISTITFVGLIIFCKDDIVEEFKKIFNV